MTTPAPTASTARDPRQNGLLRRLAASLLIVLAPVGALVVWLAVRSEVPDPLPTHWTLGGHVDGSSDRTGFVAVFLLLSAVLAVVGVVAIWVARPAAWMMTSALVFVTWVFAASLAVTLLASRGAQAAAAVSLPIYQPVLLVVGPLVAAIAVWRLHPPMPTHQTRPRAGVMTVGAEERIVWVGRVHSTPLVAVGALALLVAAVLLLVSPVAAVVVGVVGLALLATSSLSVRVDAAGLHTLWGPLGWPRQHVPIDEITSVQTQDIDPMRWGGWGLRMSRRRLAAVVRKGPGIVVERADKAPYAVTIDNAGKGAEVLEALCARAQTPPRS
jgi:hypothetical protein